MRTIALCSGGELALPERAAPSRGTLLICPGGGYSWLSPREALPIAKAFKTGGWSSAILRYACYDGQSNAPLGTLPLRQLGAAMAYLRRERPDETIAVCGFSAGGHLAASLGVHWQTLGLPRPDAMVLCYPVLTAGAFAHRASIQRLAPEGEQGFYSLEKHVGPHVPPAFLWHTAEDESVPVENSLLFASALSAAYVPFELHVFPYGRHGLSLATEEVREEGREPDAHVAQWLPLALQWLEIQRKEVPLR